jgi:hypothetical protein
MTGDYIPDNSENETTNVKDTISEREEYMCYVHIPSTGFTGHIPVSEIFN